MLVTILKRKYNSKPPQAFCIFLVSNLSAYCLVLSGTCRRPMQEISSLGWNNVFILRFFMVQYIEIRTGQYTNRTQWTRPWNSILLTRFWLEAIGVCIRLKNESNEWYRLWQTAWIKDCCVCFSSFILYLNYDKALFEYYVTVFITNRSADLFFRSGFFARFLLNRNEWEKNSNSEVPFDFQLRQETKKN